MATYGRTYDKIAIKGLAEFRRELKKLDLTNDLKDVNFWVASLVVDEGQKRARALGRMEAKAAESLRAGRAAAKASVTIGSAKVAFALGAEFGAKRYRQFKPWRGSGEGAGYFMWPAIRDQRDRMVDMYGDEIERLTAKAFPD